MAMLPALDDAMMAELIAQGLKATGSDRVDAAAVAALLAPTEHPGREPAPGDLAALLASDRFRAALGRIACFYDGGHVME